MMAILGTAPSHLHSGLRPRRARGWSSDLAMVALLGVLHVLALNVLVFNLCILNTLTFVHELVKLIEAAIGVTSALIVVRLGPLLHLVVVDNVGVHAWMILINKHILETILRLLLLLGLLPAATQVLL